MTLLRTFDRDLVTGTIVDRPNRFVVRVRFDDETERAFLGDPGALEGIVEPGRELLCAPVDDPDRATAYDAIAVLVSDGCDTPSDRQSDGVRADGIYVSVRTTLANDLFEAGLARDAIPAFEGYSLVEREPPLPDHGRTDFRLEAPDGESAYVEVQSCTHVDGRVARFPDRQTERGRRHLRSLEALVEDGTEAHLAFVVQRPDVERLRPYREVDPDFADLLARVSDNGVGLHAITTAFHPPHYRLSDADLPIDTTRGADPPG